MTVVQITEDFSNNNAGITSALLGLSKYLGEAGIQVRVVCSGSNAVHVSPPVTIESLPLSRMGAVWRFTPTLRKLLGELSERGNVVHIHGMWMHAQWEGMGTALRKRVPFILTPHNMLGGWLWRHGRIRRVKKRLYWEAIIKQRVRRANLIHALSPLERDTLRRDFFPEARIEVVPNGVDLDEISRHMVSVEFARQSDQRYALFLGRLHPVKGIERLLDAFAQYCKDAQLIIAGPCHSGTYLKRLLARVQQSGMNSRVQFLGSMDGMAKWHLLERAWVVCSPSFSEGLSMVTLEAMAAQTPVISSCESAIPEWRDGGGLVFNGDRHDLGVALNQAMSWSDSERRARGIAAREIIRRKYDWRIVGPRYLELYQSLIM